MDKLATLYFVQWSEQFSENHMQFEMNDFLKVLDKVKENAKDQDLLSIGVTTTGVIVLVFDYITYCVSPNGMEKLIDCEVLK